MLFSPLFWCVRRKNVRWQVQDATEMEMPAGSVDVIFSNWLLMYLSDAEVARLATDALRWVWCQPSFTSLALAWAS